jgi:hypothetical protein
MVLPQPFIFAHTRLSAFFERRHKPYSSRQAHGCRGPSHKYVVMPFLAVLFLVLEIFCL